MARVHFPDSELSPWEVSETILEEARLKSRINVRTQAAIRFSGQVLLVQLIRCGMPDCARTAWEKGCRPGHSASLRSLPSIAACVLLLYLCPSGLRFNPLVSFGETGTPWTRFLIISSACSAHSSPTRTGRIALELLNAIAFIFASMKLPTRRQYVTPETWK